MNTHSPFESGYVGNRDGGFVGVLDVQFPYDLLLDAGADEELLDRLTVEFEAMSLADRQRAVAAIDSGSEEERLLFLAGALEHFARQDAFAALPEEEQAALLALSEEDQQALVDLTDEERAQLVASADGEDAHPGPGELTDEQASALAALSDEERAALAALTDEQRAALAPPVDADAQEDPGAEPSAEGTAGDAQPDAQPGTAAAPDAEPPPDADAPGSEPPVGAVAPVDTQPPTGTIEEVLDWVGGDRGRAETALAVEEGRDSPRTTLMTALRQLLATPTT